ncbi:MAG: DUF3568 family protein [Candidatus Methylomirabilales bacterium]
MKRDVQIGVACAVLSTLLAGCAGFTVLTSAIAGAIYVKSQTVERTFVAPMPDVTAACRQALKEMGLTIKDDEVLEDEHHIVATASSDYEVDVTITPVTAEATRVAINADSLPARDTATGTEILNQMAAVLSPTPPAHVSASTATETVPTEHQRPIDHEPSPPPATRPVHSESPDPSTTTRPLPVATTGPSVQLTAGREPRRTAEIPKHQGSANGQLIYDTAIHDYIEGDFPAAIAHFQIYLATHPNGTERPRALYWLGESLYGQQEYTDALIQFETILLEYRQSPEAVRALLKGAQTYRQLGKTHQATRLLQTLITDHPKSPEAQVARSLMTRW